MPIRCRRVAPRADNLAEFCRRFADVGERWSNFDLVGPTHRRCGPHLGLSRPSLTSFGQHWSNLATVCPNMIYFANFDRDGPNFHPNRPILAELFQSWNNFGQHRPKLGQHSPTLGHRRPDSWLQGQRATSKLNRIVRGKLSGTLGVGPCRSCRVREFALP